MPTEVPREANSIALLKAFIDRTCPHIPGYRRLYQIYFLRDGIWDEGLLFDMDLYDDNDSLRLDFGEFGTSIFGLSDQNDFWRRITEVLAIDLGAFDDFRLDLLEDVISFTFNDN